MADLIQMQVTARIDPRSQQLMQRDLNRLSSTLQMNLGAGGLSGGTGGINASSQSMNQLSSNISRVNGNLNTLNNNFGNLQTQLRNTSNNTNNVSKGFLSLGNGIMGTIGKFAQWAVVAQLVYAPFRLIKDGINDLAELDKTLIEIAKVTDLTAREMQNLALSAGQVGVSLGRAANEYLKAVAAFSKAGLGDQAEELARVALLFANVGDMGIEDASKTIISTTQGMNLEYSNSINILDKMNAIKIDVAA